MDKRMIRSGTAACSANEDERTTERLSEASLSVSSRAMRALRTPVSFIAATALSLAFAASASAAPIQWKGYDWNVTDGGMAGVAEGKPGNVSIDTSGALHLNVKNNAGVWTASELFTSQKLGFGSYQWLIEGPVDTFDKQIVLGLFPYGPVAGIGSDGTNEIDIEWARWGQASGVNVGFTDYPASGSVVGTKSFQASLGGSTLSTARFTWSSQYIESAVLKGHQAMTSETGLLAKWKYSPTNATTNIPQQALPLGINLWCFDAPPSDGRDVEIVLRDFQFVKEGDPLPSGGAGGATSGGAGGATSGGAGGATSGGAASGGAGGATSTGSSGAATGGTGSGGRPSDLVAGAGGGGAGGSDNSLGASGQLVSGGSASGPIPTQAGAANTAASGQAGCSCRVTSGSSSAGWLVASWLALVVLARRRRAA